MSKINSKDYVVLDVETNGLSSLKHDLLSISIYKPDDNKTYDRFLPLELNSFVETYWINGIDEDMLSDKTPLTQEEFDKLVNDFELDRRTILTYGSIDEKFIKNYLKRKKINGFEKLKFYNFKHNIISSKFSEGNITKDNLCRMYNVGDVQDIHSGHEDCLLEWQLFRKIYNKFLLIVSNNVYELSDKYIVPVSYLQSYNNFKYYMDIPKVYIKTKTIKKFELNKMEMTRFDTNISGISIEHLINTMLNVKKVSSCEFELKNKSNLTFAGRLPSELDEIPIILKNDGTIFTWKVEHKKYIEEVNKTTKQLKTQIEPLIEYIKTEIFNNKRILSQELIVDKRYNISCKCDLSNEYAVLEIKTGNNLDFEKIKLQLYCESNNRPVYVLHFDWNELKFIITKIDFIDELDYFKIKRKDDIKKSTKKFQQRLPNNDLLVLEYINSNYPVKLKCLKCNNEWSCNYNKILCNPICPKCFPQKHVTLVEKKVMVKEKDKINYGKKFSEKIFSKSNGTIAVLKYYGSKSNAEVGCLICNHIWKIRADHLLDRCYCPNCKKNNSK